MIKFELEDGSVVKEWNDIGDRKIKSVSVDVISLGYMSGVPLLVFSGYDKYMYQKYGMVGIGLSSGEQRSVALAGVQVGGFVSGKGWIIMDVNLLQRRMEIKFSEKITSIAIKEGVK